MTDYSYLDGLINEVKELRSKTAFNEIDITKCGLSYMPTKKTSFVGFKQGYSDYLIKIQNGIKETEKIRSTTKDYLRLIKNEDDEPIQIEHETYTKNSSGQVDYNYINYVSGGKYPVLEERKGEFYFNPLTYVEKFRDSWLNHREV